MSIRGHSCVQWALIGTTLSKFLAVYCHKVADHTPSRTRAKLINGKIQVAGDQWPVFLYADFSYDTEDPWNGLLHSGLLVSVRSPFFLCFFTDSFHKAFKHTFTSPSFVDQEPKATRSGCYDRFSSPVGDKTENGSEVGGILTTAHREFGGCTHCCAGKPKRREQDQADPRRRGHTRSGTAEG